MNDGWFYSLFLAEPLWTLIAGATTVAAFFQLGPFGALWTGFVMFFGLPLLLGVLFT